MYTHVCLKLAIAPDCLLTDRQIGVWHDARAFSAPALALNPKPKPKKTLIVSRFSEAKQGFECEEPAV